MNTEWKNSSTITGSDIYITLNGVLIGNGAGLVIDVSRDKRPVYTFGAVDPRAIGRGTRLITGMLNIVNIKTSVVAQIMKDTDDYIYIHSESGEGDTFIRGFNEYKKSENGDVIDTGNGIFVPVIPVLLDELPPVDLVLVGVNEAGLKTKMVVRGVEFTTVQWGITMDDVASAERVSFLARTYEPLSEIVENNTVTPPVEV